MGIHLAINVDDQLEVAINSEITSFCHALNREIAKYHWLKMKALIKKRSPEKIESMEQNIIRNII